MLGLACFDGLNGSIATTLGTMHLTAEEARIVGMMFKRGFTAAYFDLINGFLDMQPLMQEQRRRALHVHVSGLRKKLRPIGLDIVTIANFGLRLDDAREETGRRARVEYNRPKASDFPPPPAPPKPSLQTPMSTADKLRALDLHERNYSPTMIAALLRKPYRDIERVVNGARAA